MLSLSHVLSHGTPAKRHAPWYSGAQTSVSEPPVALRLDDLRRVRELLRPDALRYSIGGATFHVPHGVAR